MSNCLLEVKDLRIKYQTDLETVHAVNGISFSIDRGQTLGLVGETGAGKTTTAHAIMRLLPERTGVVEGGDILFEGESILTVAEESMRDVRGDKIAMIFQDPMTSLNPVIPVGKQIKESLVLHNRENLSDKQIDERVDRILQMVGISPDRKNDYPHQFSGGMKQRVIIAMALVCEPGLLIADEPTTALDVTIQAQVLMMMRDLNERLGTAMIIITHDLGVVAQMCDYVAVMYAGEIVEKGTLHDVFTGDKHHPYTEGLFGAIPNIKDKSKRLVPIEGLMPDPTRLPEGCSFAERCTYCKEVCLKSKPDAYTEGSHTLSCHLFAREDA